MQLLLMLGQVNTALTGPIPDRTYLKLAQRSPLTYGAGRSFATSTIT